MREKEEIDICDYSGKITGNGSIVVIIKNHLFTKNKMKLETLDILVMLNRRSVTDHKPDNFEECGTGWCVLTFGWR